MKTIEKFYFEVVRNGNIRSAKYVNCYEGILPGTESKFKVLSSGRDSVTVEYCVGETGASYGTFGSANPLDDNDKAKEIKEIKAGESLSYYSDWQYNGRVYTTDIKITLRKIEPISLLVWNKLIIKYPKEGVKTYTREAAYTQLKDSPVGYFNLCAREYIDRVEFWHDVDNGWDSEGFHDVSTEWEVFYVNAPAHELCNNIYVEVRGDREEKFIFDPATCEFVPMKK